MTMVLPVVLMTTSVASISCCFMPMRCMAFCISRGFMPGIIRSPDAQERISIRVENEHDDHHHAGDDDDVTGLEAQLAVVLVEIPDQAAHAGRHLDPVVSVAHGKISGAGISRLLSGLPLHRGAWPAPAFNSASQWTCTARGSPSQPSPAQFRRLSRLPRGILRVCREHVPEQARNLAVPDPSSFARRAVSFLCRCLPSPGLSGESRHNASTPRL